MTNNRLEPSTDPNLGSLTIDPVDPIVVGQHGTWTLTYTVGAYGMDVGGSLKIGMRRMADWGTPQFADPRAANYATVRCSTPARLSVRYDGRGHIRPFRAVIVVDIEERVLYPGDRIVVILGDRSGGGPGMQAQTFPETNCEFAVFADPLSSGEYRRVRQVTPIIPAVGGPVERFEIQAPSTARAGVPFRVLVRAVDRFGNAVPTAADGLSITSDPPVSFSLKPEDGPAKWVDGVAIEHAGSTRLRLRSGTETIAIGNPILVRADDAEWKIFWGETQGQTANTVGAGGVDEYFKYARDVAGIDYCTHQGHDFMMSDADWRDVCRETKAFHRPGRFVTFLGYEWSGTTGAGGDRNVMYLDDDEPLYRCSAWQNGEERTETAYATAAEIHAEFHRMIERKGRRVVMQPHVGGRRSDIDIHDPVLEPLIEIASAHGIFEWRLREALERGYRIGVVCASDDCTCRPGLTFPTTPEMAIRGGLGAMLARDLTRESIWEAMLARRCYGTTGPRIVVDVEADGRPMGAEFATEAPPSLHGRVFGTAPIDSITLFDRTREVMHVTPNEPKRDPRRLRILWSGAKGKDRNRYTVWDGALRLHGGKILSAESLNMFAARYGIVERGTDGLSWRSVTAGHEVGILLELDAPDDARVVFETGPATFEFSVGEARANDIRVDAGGVEQAVRVTTVHADGEIDRAEFSVVEEELEPGEHAYWVRVVQRDFHRAWSSPIYVDYKISAAGRGRR